MVRTRDPGEAHLGRRRPAERARPLLEAASPRVNGSGGSAQTAVPTRCPCGCVVRAVSTRRHIELNARWDA